MRQSPASRGTSQGIRPSPEGLRQRTRRWSLSAFIPTHRVLDAPNVSADDSAALWSFLSQVWRVVRPLVFMVPVVQVLILLWVIWTHTPTVPYRDEWWYVTLVRHANEGSLTFNDFWAVHYYSHRIVIPRIVDLSLIELTHWNRQIMATFDLALGIASGGLLFVSALRTLKSTSVTLAVVIPLSLLALSWSQYENWLNPFQIEFIATFF